MRFTPFLICKSLPMPVFEAEVCPDCTRFSGFSECVFLNDLFLFDWD